MIITSKVLNELIAITLNRILWNMSTICSWLTTNFNCAQKELENKTVGDSKKIKAKYETVKSEETASLFYPGTLLCLNRLLKIGFWACSRTQESKSAAALISTRDSCNKANPARHAHLHRGRTHHHTHTTSWCVQNVRLHVLVDVYQQTRSQERLRHHVCVFMCNLMTIAVSSSSVRHSSKISAMCKQHAWNQHPKHIHIHTHIHTQRD